MAKKKVEQVKEEASVVEQTTEQVVPEAVAPQLTVEDLQMLSKIVDLATRRGAFQAAELTQVGTSFDKLAAFLAFVDEAQAKERAATEEAAKSADGE